MPKIFWEAASELREWPKVCCAYHRTGGSLALKCGGDIYVPEEPEKPGTQFRVGFNGGWQP